MKRDTFDIICGIEIIVVFFAVIAFCFFTIVKSEQRIEEAMRPTYIDSTQVQVVYIDTWGKIFIKKEEDL